MQTIHPSPLLRFGLGLDAAVSAAMALLQLAWSGWLAQAVNLPTGLLVETGAFMAVYALALGLLARSQRIWTSLVWLIALGNLGWATACLLAGALLVPGPLGIGYLLAQAAGVCLFAALQWQGLRRSAPVRAGAAAGPAG